MYSKYWKNKVVLKWIHVLVSVKISLSFKWIDRPLQTMKTCHHSLLIYLYIWKHLDTYLLITKKNIYRGSYMTLLEETGRMPSVTQRHYFDIFRNSKVYHTAKKLASTKKNVFPARGDVKAQLWHTNGRYGGVGNASCTTVIIPKRESSQTSVTDCLRNEIPTLIAINIWRNASATPNAVFWTIPFPYDKWTEKLFHWWQPV